MADPNLQITIGATDQTRAAFEQVQTQMKRTEAQAAQLGASVGRSQASFRQFGSATQQAGYQLQDFAVQVTSGTSALTAFGQQASQFLGIFGTGGAIAGAAIAVGVLAIKMWEMASNAEKARDVTDDLADEMERLNKEAEKLARGDVRIRATVQVEDLGEQIRILEEMRDAVIAQQTGGISGELPLLGLPSTTQLDERIKALRQKLQEFDREIERQEQRDDQAARTRRRGEEAVEAIEAERRARERMIREEADAERQREAARQRFLSDVAALEGRLDPTAAATRRWFEEQTLLNRALDEGLILSERHIELIAASDAAYRRATEQTVQVTEVQIRATKEADNVARDLGLTFQSAFEDAIVRGEKLRNVLAGIAQDIARIIVRQTVTTPLAGALQGALGGIGGFFSGLFAGPGDIRGPGGSVSIPFGGPRAMGGPVASGTAYLVGEEGPEIFMPGASGRIIPNGAGGPVIHQTINISTGVSQTVRAELLALMPSIKRQTVEAVADARMRGGSFASAMGT